MTADARVAEAAHLLSQPARVRILSALAGGDQVTAGRLAIIAGVSPATASNHLKQLLVAGLVAGRREGRRRVYQLDKPGVIEAMEVLARLVPDRPATSYRRARDHTAMRAARTCYDHMAGQLAVNIREALVRRGMLVENDNEFQITKPGYEFLMRMGINAADLKAQRRSTARMCMDWSEGQPHVAGALGAALLDLFNERRWIARIPETRAVRVTPAGRIGIRDHFGISV